MLLAVLVLGCEAVSEDDDGLVSWAGYVYMDVDAPGEARLAEGNVTFWPVPFVADAQLAGDQPYDDYPGYWEVRVMPAAATLVRITSELTRPTVWAGDAPEVDGNWLSGALFGVTDVWIEDTFDPLAGDGDAWVDIAVRGEVLVIGRPLDDTVECQHLSVIAGGVEHRPTCWLQDDAGVTAAVSTGPVSWFAASASAGEVVVSWLDASEVYRADAGDVVMAWYLVGAS
ncbi:MAG: hypothetical protein EXR71_04700 [Myxococcales bacterium]|nr:hypothetical protein [Myxococcales bacterium]